ncbi:MAG: recombinase family protein [Caulobacteraceae bacterium]|nr:recombinase family protein [Caulobacteraceae bacterium]NBX77111.1 recombinase family protein [Pseudomonadota bacterium]
MHYTKRAKHLNSRFVAPATGQLRAVIYVRTSTQEQQSGIEEQETLCRAYCEQHSIQVVDVFKEHDSGRNDDRRQLAAAMMALQRGRANALVVARVDRLARNARKFGEVRDDFARNGWLLMSADPSEREMSDGTANQRFMTNMMAIIAEYSAARSNERVRENFRYRATVGLSTGPLWGFKSVGPSRMRRFAPQDNGDYEKLVGALMYLDSLDPEAYNDVSYRHICRVYDIRLSDGTLDGKKVKRVWEAWIRGKYRPLVPEAHVKGWQRAHDLYCEAQLRQARTGLGAASRVAAR